MAILDELRAQRIAVIDDLKALNASTADRDLTDEEQTQFDALTEKADSLKARIDRAAKVADLDASLDRSARRSQPDQPTEVPSDNPRVKQVMAVGEPNWVNDPKKGFKNPREFMNAVMNAYTRRKVDERLSSLKGKKFATAGSDEHGEYSDPYGGFMVPEGFSPQVLSIDAEMDPSAALTTKVPMSTPTLRIPARVDKNHTSSVSGGLTVTRKAETAAAVASRMQLEQVELTAHNLFGFSYITEELLTDSPVSFAAILAAGFSDEFTSKILSERLSGTGVGEFLGVLNAACTVSVTKDSGQAADTISYTNILNMRSRCYRYGNAVWMANHDTLPQLAKLNTPVGTGGTVVWAPSAREDVPDMLLGRPIYFSEYCETLGDKGDIYLCNWAEYLEGVLQPLQSAESIHVRFAEHERAFKFWLRNAGTPWWSAPLTPKKSAATISPFVVLAARA